MSSTNQRGFKRDSSTNALNVQVDGATRDDMLLGADRRSDVIGATGRRTERKDVNTLALVSGTLWVARAIAPIRAGQPVNGLRIWTGNLPVVTPANEWACIIDDQTNRNVLAKTADKTTEAWGLDEEKAFTFASPWTPTVDTQPYFGILITAATMPNLMGAVHSRGSITKQSPMLAATSTTGLTTPATLGATAAAFSAQATVLYFEAI